ncbi:unnamed protein product [Acanthoscelides obtectus]|uniref:Uncharacterized protein n=1 Tax=Acanthoscelides obtectus TaxID=200917 RepID=A0A9P0PLY5_ACAOB|nr:unnamed protein product [Acanthoscelides obtectus]CAK1646054.1 hypothetical protein AOBTE_LOCUS14418 [Acanthoscelides obtectus]
MMFWKVSSAIIHHTCCGDFDSAFYLLKYTNAEGLVIERLVIEDLENNATMYADDNTYICCKSTRSTDQYKAEMKAMDPEFYYLIKSGQ